MNRHDDQLLVQCPWPVEELDDQMGLSLYVCLGYNDMLYLLKVLQRRLAIA